MRLVVTTVYEGIDQEFVEHYAHRIVEGYGGDPDIRKAMSELVATGRGAAVDNNPENDSEMVTTTYRVVFSGDQEGRGLQEANI